MPNSALRQCVEPGCAEPAGTPWTDHWCPRHDEERRTRISASLDAMARSDYFDPRDGWIAGAEERGDA